MSVRFVLETPSSTSSRRPLSRYAPRSPTKRAIISVTREASAAVTPKTNVSPMARSMIGELSTANPVDNEPGAYAADHPPLVPLREVHYAVFLGKREVRAR